MATTHWRKGYSVAQLYTQPDAGWSFHQLAHLLLGMKVGEDDVLESLTAKITFVGSLQRSLPPGEIRKVLFSEDMMETALLKETVRQKEKNNKAGSTNWLKSKKHTIECSYYNLTGLDGPLAEPFSDMMREDKYYGEGAMAAFINIFNNRIHALRYVIHAQTNYTLTNSKASESTIGEFLLALSGHYYSTQRSLHGQHDDTLLALSGHLANCRMTLSTVRKLFEIVLALPVVKMNSLIGRWLSVQSTDHSRLGKKNHRLGSEAALGKRVWDQQAVFELELGPMTRQRISELVPGGIFHYQLRDLLAWISERRVDCLITFICLPDSQVENNATLLSTQLGVTNRLGYGSALIARTQRVQRIRFLVATVC
ncbi:MULTISPECIES: type VI secretion system baseplate subunit TssG [Marinomonas]|uniref:Type VI secretion system baseplate subunit TssG n=1 Tax=Marinomonas rhodophyticola TaxID=2992803 RepID=A0ABT3KE48_9GAMM|nr:type VI secretion system baseplate subunit TssG [Marinomonas sp. KJ51-3]MCW4628456.1 type VI secretion system baseplate subunit TssG [Marinomonas sp. KJ51-3]